MHQRLELTRIGWLKAALRWRGFQPTLMLVTLFFFALAVLTGFFGTPAGSHNFGIIFVWIVWWAALIMLSGHSSGVNFAAPAADRPFSAGQ